MDKIMAGDVDVTEKVQILYDMAHSSMDWGSGMLDNEEMEKVIEFAVMMGWEVPDLPNEGPQAAVALKFPDQYDIEEIHYPAVERRGQYGTFTQPAWSRIRSRRKSRS